MPEPEEVDTLNRFMVAVQGEKLAIMRPPRGLITRAEALALAAWLVALADWDGSEFPKYLEAVKAT